MLLYRPEYYLRDNPAEAEKVAGLCEIDVAKNRDGRTGVTKLHFTKHTTMFSRVHGITEDGPIETEQTGGPGGNGRGRARATGRVFGSGQ